MLDEIAKRQPLLKSGVVFTYGEIDADTFPEIVAALTEAKFYANNQPVKYFLTSSGGYADVSMALYEYIAGIGGIHTYALGNISSGALLPFIAGERRFVSKYTSMGFHRAYLSTLYGVDSVLAELQVARMEALDKNLAAILGDISHKDKNWWEQLLGKGHSQVCKLLSSSEIVEYGLAAYAKQENFIITRPPDSSPKTEPVVISQSTGLQPGSENRPKSD